MRFNPLRHISSTLRFIRDRRRLLRSGLLDAKWYRTQAHLKVYTDPAAHYLGRGAREGLDPHPLFLTLWYAQRYPDASKTNPALHYILHGAREGRDPNPYFSSSWYISAYPDVLRQNANPLAHYIRHGMREGRRPSARFDPAFYCRHLHEGDPARKAPLVHFLAFGEREGLRPAPELIDKGGEPVDWSELAVQSPWRGGAPREAALFVAHAKDGRTKPHVSTYVRALEAEDVAVILVVATDGPFVDDEALSSSCALYVRANAGFDFAAWAHLLKLIPHLWDAERLYLVNDSVVGPVSQPALHDLILRVRRHDADVVGLTQSRERGWHLQSYFLALNAKALKNAKLQSFFNSVRNFADKQDVIDRYEVAFASEAVDAGLRVGCLFTLEGDKNPTLFHWRALLDAGFPFLKTAVIEGRFPDVDREGWGDALASHGFDLSLLKTHEAAPKQRAPVVLPLGPAPDTLSFYGPWNYANGLGQASRGYISALRRLSNPLSLHGLKLPFHTHRRLAPPLDIRDFAGPAATAVVHLNPDAWHLLTPEQLKEIDRAQRRVGLWVWELSSFPEFFRPNAEAVDVIWAPSRYCADVFAAATGRRALVIPHVVTLPAAAPSGPLRHNILYIFDGSSYIARKNPWALIRAFKRSNLHASGWTLTLKTKNLRDHPVEAAALVARCEFEPGVRLIDQPISQQQVGELLLSADIYASPHASEGFGLTIAEAMAAGKAVVATNYGGSTDFLDDQTGYPVAFELTPLDRDYGHYQAGSVWAAIDEDELARTLCRAANDLEQADHAKGRRARERVEQRLSPEAVGAQILAALTDAGA